MRHQKVRSVKLHSHPHSINALVPDKLTWGLGGPISPVSRGSVLAVMAGEAPAQLLGEVREWPPLLFPAVRCKGPAVHQAPG